ncbi:hypothetical protein ACS0TY_034529 [Phlomoides rotata]
MYRSRLWVSCVMATSEDRGDDVLDLGMVEGSTRERGSSFFLAGQLCTSMLINVFALMDVMERAFKSRTKAVPWHFDGNLFMGKLLSGSEQPSIVTISKGSFSTRAYDIPIMYQMEATLISIVSRVGAMEVFEPPDDNNLGSYLCFKAVVDITKPLVRGLKIRVNGDDIWVPIKCYGPWFGVYPCRALFIPKRSRDIVGVLVATNPGQKAWKHSAREKGKGSLVGGGSEVVEFGTKRWVENINDLMDVDLLSNLPKRERLDLESVESDVLV